MNPEDCPLEARVLAVLRAGCSDPEILRHLDRCSACGAAALAERALRSLAEERAAAHGLPSPGIVLLRARLRARREAGDRSLRPVLVWQRIVTLVAAAGLTLGAVAGAPVLAAFGGLGGGKGLEATPARFLLGAGLLVLATLAARQVDRDRAGLSAG